ncbi:hypothetical protein [Hymenobacter antarcticus]|uniref:hypothetical protein n=1 Tax=Hymenobacter antarcticus TaxID=486270 RepID=UPI0031EEFC69
MKQFEFTQYHTGKLLLIWLGGLVAIIFLAVKGMNTAMATASPTVKMAWFIAVFAVGFYGLFRWGKAVSAKPTLIVIDDAGLTILDRKSGESQRVLFGDVVAYQHSDFNNVERLRIKLKNGTKQKIIINTKLHSDQQLGRMVRAFETALAAHQQQVGDAKTALREKTFFEKPISTVVMVLLSTGAAWLVWDVFTSGRPVKWGSLLLISGNFVVYLGAWLAASGKRRQE